MLLREQGGGACTTGGNHTEAYFSVQLLGAPLCYAFSRLLLLVRM